MVDSSLLTSEQAKRGVKGLTDLLEKEYEKDEPEVDDDAADDSNDEDDEYCPRSENLFNPRNKAMEEMNRFIRNYKRSELLPTFKENENTKILHGTECATISDHVITIGNVIKEPGEDLPSGMNYSKYFDTMGKFQHVQFWLEHKKQFPKLWAYAVGIASANPTEVSCETLFSQSGYASNSRRTRLKSKHFERQTIVASSLQNVFFDVERAVDLFIKREDKNDWGDGGLRDELNYGELFGDDN